MYQQLAGLHDQPAMDTKWLDFIFDDKIKIPTL